jgi:hypothetical protein
MLRNTYKLNVNVACLVSLTVVIYVRYKLMKASVFHKTICLTNINENHRLDKSNHHVRFTTKYWTDITGIKT